MRVKHNPVLMRGIGRAFIAAALSTGLMSCVQTHPKKSANCARLSPMKCGSGERITFKVMVSSESQVLDVIPNEDTPSEAIKEAARCIAAYPGNVEKLIVRSRFQGPGEFELSYGPLFCDWEQPP